MCKLFLVIDAVFLDTHFASFTAVGRSLEVKADYRSGVVNNLTSSLDGFDSGASRRVEKRKRVTLG